MKTICGWTFLKTTFCYLSLAHIWANTFKLKLADREPRTNRICRLVCLQDPLMFREFEKLVGTDIEWPAVKRFLSLTFSGMCGDLQATWHQHQAPPTNMAWVGNISGNVVTGRSQIITGWYHLAMASIRQQCCQINWWLPHRIYHHWNLRYGVGGLEMYNFWKLYNSWLR